MKKRKEIIISASGFEKRVAILEEGKLVEFYTEREERQSLVGRIYKGRVESVMKGLKSAFVNIGLPKNAFLPLSEVPFEEFLELYEPEVEMGPLPNIQKRKLTLREGQEVLCQIRKDPFSLKGPRVSSYISLPGRYLVMMLNTNRIGVSRRIKNPKSRERLWKILKEIKPKGIGFIARTAAEGASKDEIKEEARILEEEWKEIEAKAKREKAPFLIYEGPDLIIKTIRDSFTTNVQNLFVDSQEEYNRILEYLRSTSPKLRSRVKLYKEDPPIFEAFGIEEGLSKALNRKVWLKSGGFITIDETEALTAIDVNTGKFSSEENFERMVFLTNLEAASEIARQIRLRNLAGLILIDFIDMKKRENIQRVVAEFRKHLSEDKAKFDLTKVSEFGVLEMTRERVRPSLLSSLTEPCPCCDGKGRVLSKEEVVTKLERFFYEKRKELEGRRVELFLNPRVMGYLTIQKVAFLEHLAKKYKVGLKLREDPDLPPSEFQVLL